MNMVLDQGIAVSPEDGLTKRGSGLMELPSDWQ